MLKARYAEKSTKKFSSNTKLQVFTLWRKMYTNITAATTRYRRQYRMLQTGFYLFFMWKVFSYINLKHRLDLIKLYLNYQT